MGKRIKKKNRTLPKERRTSASSFKANSVQAHVAVDNDESGVSLPKGKISCPHLENGFDFKVVSEKITNTNPGRCQDCRDGMADSRHSKVKAKQGKKKGDVSKATWVCLQCGQFSCGGVGLPRTIQSHAVRHHKQTCHPLVIQRENLHLRWCFQCDNFFSSEISDSNGSKRDVLSDVVKLIKSSVSEQNSVVAEDGFPGRSDVTTDSLDCPVPTGSRKTGCHMVRGLTNLGNTCFFNSVMQNLLAINSMRDYFLTQETSYGPLSNALRKIYHEASCETGLKNTMNPRSLFGSVCSKAPQFRGFQQQDSHELLRYLLDGLSTEELVVKKQLDPRPVNDASAASNSTFVDSTFGGQVSSTVTCMECGHTSTVFEPFLDLSLPVPMRKPPGKRAQLSNRFKKSRLPPKKCSKIGSKGPKLSEPSVNGQPFSGVSSNSNAEDEASVDNQEVPSLTNSDIEQGIPLTENLADSGYEFSWMEFVDPEVSSDNNAVSSCQHAPERSDNPEVATSDNQTLDIDSSRLWEEEVLQLVSTSEVLILPYHEENASPEEKKDEEAVEAEASSSVVDAQYDQVFEGFGDLFNEPENAESGFAADNSCDSDLDEVDDTNAPVSVDSCLIHFIKPELLSDDNAWECENCSKTLFRKENESNAYSENHVPDTNGYATEPGNPMTKQVKRDATKRVLIDKAPLILTVHLKRFSQDGRGRLSKLNGHVKFGESLDLAPYMDPRRCSKGRYPYRLLGVVEHMGSMRQGHYVAYVGSCGKWYHASDAHVHEVPLEDVLRSQAYILFYQLIDS